MLFRSAHSRDLGGIKAPLREWEARGDVEFVEDVQIQPEIVVRWFEEMGQRYNILKIGIDRFRFFILNAEFKKIGFDAHEKKNIILVRPILIMQAAPVINSLFINRMVSFGDVPIMRWYTNNTKKIMDDKGNVTYGKIEPRYRKTDGFMAFVNTIVLLDEIPEEVDYTSINFDVYSY